MEATQVPGQQQVEKYLVRNNTAGYVGVVKINRHGEEKGENIPPYGTMWLTYDEMVATAQATARPEDNPFEEQTLIGVDPETQAKAEFKIRPLTVESDPRYVPTTDRYVPTPDAPQDTAPAPTQEAARAPEPVAAPPTTGSTAAHAAPPPPAPPVVAPAAPAPRQGVDPPQGLAGEQASPEREGQESWVTLPEAPGEVLAGSLSGSDDAADAAQAPQASDAPGERFVPSITAAQAAPQTVGSEEEHAAAVDPEIGEETGAARPPVQPPAEGEFAQAEEVGSPEAPRNGPAPVGE